MLGPMQPTIGVDCGIQRESIRSRDDVTMRVWDTPGLHRFQSIVSWFVQKASVVLFVYDIGNLETFLSIQQHWASTTPGAQRSRQTLCVLVGNNADTHNREVSYDDGSGYAATKGFQFFEVSCMTGASVDHMFGTIARCVVGDDNQLVDPACNLDTLKCDPVNKPRACESCKIS
jgi:small GTP-binding protein